MKSLPVRPARALLALALLALGAVAAPRAAEAGDSAIAHRYFLRSRNKAWHSVWYDPSIGRPMALVVPPTAEFTAEYAWGVPSHRVVPLYHQFRRPYPGPGAVPGSGGGLYPTPMWPSDTVQFGVHPVRGPW
ncbi:MAG: hypothetical protein KGQ61_09150 [Planctomycetes bacterium]|nr:hypothetical protein [Planctomycetota bacterium]